MELKQAITIDRDYKVIVGCLTYNHAKYIVDALNGFAMQKTNFPFVCIVIDDASTDGEPEVIRDWLQKECDMDKKTRYDLDLAEVIMVPHKDNANCTMAVYFLKMNLYKDPALKFDLVKDWGGHSEYLALCEGDDYWIDPDKLQIQSDCLDAHPEVDMCAHSYREVSAISGKTIRDIRRRKKDCIIPVEDVIVGGGDFFATDSIFYRVSMESDIPAFRQYMDSDYTLAVHGALKGGIYYLSRNMSVYRRFVENSWCTNMSANAAFQVNHNSKLYEMLSILNEEYDFKYEKYIKNILLKTMTLAINTGKENRRILICYWKSFFQLPLLPKMKVLAKCVCPKFGYKVVDLARKRYR